MKKKGRAGSVQTQTALSSAEKPLRRVRRKEGFVMAIENKIREVCEDLGWKWTDCGDFIELENGSPAGEDLVLTCDKRSLTAEIREYAITWDIDEHIEMWVRARQHVSGVPSVRELCQDAEDIYEMLQDLAAAVAKCEEEYK